MRVFNISILYHDKKTSKFELNDTNDSCPDKNSFKKIKSSKSKTVEKYRHGVGEKSKQDNILLISVIIIEYAVFRMIIRSILKQTELFHSHSLNG
jgi:hypothetical protein